MARDELLLATHAQPRHTHGRSRRAALIMVLCAWAFVAGSGPALAEGVVGAVVLLNDPTEGAHIVRQAQGIAPGRWRAVHAKASAKPTGDHARAVLRKLEQAYLEADFLGCMSLLQRPALAIDRLLQAAPRERAARVAVLAAACAHGSRDLDLSQRLLRRVFIRELDTASAFAGMRPDFRSLADKLRKAILARGRAELRVVLTPADAQLRVDGGVHRCVGAPCSLALLPGEHLIEVARFGHATRTIRHRVSGRDRLAFTLEPASTVEAQSQLGVALREGRDPGSISFAKTASSAYEAPLVLLLWRDRGQRNCAAVYDRRLNRLVSRISVQGANQGQRDAARAALIEWRGVISPPLYRKPLFWAAIAGAAATIGVVSYLLLQPARPRHYEIAFP